MNNLTKQTDLSVVFLKKESLAQRERLKIRKFLVWSIIFTVFAMACSLLVTNSVPNQKLASNLQNRLNLCHIISLQAISLGILFLSGEKKEK